MKKILSIMILFSMAAVLANAEDRNALLIANSKYKNFSSLSQPISEAHNFGAALEQIGFDVTIVENATKEDMQIALMSFKKKTADGGIALLHYG
ncbi:MAG: caspase family protein, partial [Spirochaetales bacterium]|nr:caspase family protein [Spirochaetales bacterium]